MLAPAFRIDVAPESDRDMGIDFEANAIEICQHVGNSLTGFTDLLRVGRLHEHVPSAAGAWRPALSNGSVVERGGGDGDGEGP